MSDILITLVLATGLAGAYYLYKMLRRPPGFPPGPPALPVVGSLPYLGKSDDQHEFFKAMQELAKKHGPVFSIALGHKWTVVLTDHTSIKEAMVQRGVDFAGRPHYEDGKLFNPHAPIHGIIDTTYSDQWKLQRHATMQALRHLGYGRKITEECIIEEAEMMIKTLKGKDKAPIDVQDHLASAVANVVVSLLFGERFEYENEEFTNLRRCVDRAIEAMLILMDWEVIPGRSLMPKYWKATKEVKEAYGELNAFLRSKIDEIPCEDVQDPRNFVEAYHMERKKNPKIENRIEQILADFIQAGLETTSTALGWAFYYMLAHPDIQQKIHDELDQKIGSQRGPVLSDKESLPFLEATLLEVLRISTIAPMALEHQTMVDTTVGGYSIPKDTKVWVMIFAVQMDPDNFPEPEVFKPERFIGPDGKVQHNEKLIAFGVGRRACIGEQLAKQEFFLLFANLMHAFKITNPEGQKLPEPKGTFGLVHRPPKFNINVISRQ